MRRSVVAYLPRYSWEHLLQVRVPTMGNQRWNKLVTSQWLVSSPDDPPEKRVQVIYDDGRNSGEVQLNSQRTADEAANRGRLTWIDRQGVVILSCRSERRRLGCGCNQYRIFTHTNRALPGLVRCQYCDNGYRSIKPKKAGKFRCQEHSLLPETNFQATSRWILEAEIDGAHPAPPTELMFYELSEELSETLGRRLWEVKRNSRTRIISWPEPLMGVAKIRVVAHEYFALHQQNPEPEMFDPQIYLILEVDEEGKRLDPKKSAEQFLATILNPVNEYGVHTAPTTLYMEYPPFPKLRLKRVEPVS